MAWEFETDPPFEQKVGTPGFVDAEILPLGIAPGSRIDDREDRRVRGSGDDRVINGNKCCTTKGSVADFPVVMWVTSPGSHPYQDCSVTIVPASTRAARRR